ncbi:MAG: hypothetical protein RRA32_04775 [bacterium]|nr:hypothetical protein [bacterium]
MNGATSKVPLQSGSELDEDTARDVVGPALLRFSLKGTRPKKKEQSKGDPGNYDTCPANSLHKTPDLPEGFRFIVGLSIIHLRISAETIHFLRNCLIVPDIYDKHTDHLYTIHDFTVLQIKDLGNSVFGHVFVELDQNLTLDVSGLRGFT